MIYKTVVLEYEPKAKKMAQLIENEINTRVSQGWTFVTFSITNSCKAILVFTVPEGEENTEEETVEGEE